MGGGRGKLQAGFRELVRSCSQGARPLSCTTVRYRLYTEYAFPLSLKRFKNADAARARSRSVDYHDLVPEMFRAVLLLALWARRHAW